MSESMKNTKQFMNVYRNGRSYANRELVMYVLRNQTDENILGISVSKKVGNSVVRHRVTRLIRESYRLSEEKLTRGLDIVVVARVNAKDKNYFDINKAMMHLAKLHRIVIMEEMKEHD